MVEGYHLQQEEVDLQMFSISMKQIQELGVKYLVEEANQIKHAVVQSLVLVEEYLVEEAYHAQQKQDFEYFLVLVVKYLVEEAYRIQQNLVLMLAVMIVLAQKMIE